MNHTRSILVGLCLIGLSITAWGQTLNSPSAAGIPGHLDPRTGTFTPIPAATVTEDGPTTVPTTGKVVLTLTVTLQTTFGTGAVYSCGLTASTFDVSSSLSFFDSIQVAGTKSGNTVTCNITLPYSWALVSRGSDTMNIAYSVSAANSTSGGLPVRLAQHGIANIPVPTSGTTTTYTLATLI